MVETVGPVGTLPPPPPVPSPTTPAAPQAAGAATGQVTSTNPNGTADQAATSAPAAGGGGEKAGAKKSGHTADSVIGFNPSAKIDPDTHMVVLTVRDQNGNTIRQIPNEHELAAYKAELAQHKK